MKDITIKLSAIFRKEFKRLAKKYRSLPFDLDKLITRRNRQTSTNRFQRNLLA